MQTTYLAGEEATSALTGFHTGPSILVQLEFGDVGFCGRREPEEPEEKPSKQGENRPQTQPTYGTGPESKPGRIDGRGALSPLRHPCSVPKWHFLIHSVGHNVWVPELFSGPQTTLDN